MWNDFFSQSLSVFASFMSKLFYQVCPLWGHSAHTVSPHSSPQNTVLYLWHYFITKIYISVPSLCCSFPPLLVGYSRFGLVLCLGESFLQCKLASDVWSSQGWPWPSGPSVSISQVLGSQPLYFQLCLWISFISSPDLTDGCHVSVELSRNAFRLESVKWAFPAPSSLCVPSLHILLALIL